jgi:hypothetical protein
MQSLNGVQPETILVTSCGAPVRIVSVESDGLRADCELACGVIENIGCGNLCRAERYEVDSFFRMRNEK